MSGVVFMNVTMTNSFFRGTSTTSNKACKIYRQRKKISTLCANITSKLVQCLLHHIHIWRQSLMEVTSLSTLTTIFWFISFSTEMLRQFIIFDLRLPSREVDENCVLLHYYTMCSGNSLLMFEDIRQVLSSRVKNRIQGFDY